MAELSEADIKKILLEHRYLESADAICKKWGITRNRLRTWKREYKFEYLCGGLRELVIVALRSKPVRDPAELVTFLDYHDHTIYTAQEITAALDGLVAEKIAVRRRGVWHYDDARLARAARPFVF